MVQSTARWSQSGDEAIWTPGGMNLPEGAPYTAQDIGNYIKEDGHPDLAEAFVAMSTGQSIDRIKRGELKDYFKRTSPFSESLNRIGDTQKLSWTAIQQVYENKARSEIDRLIYGSETAKALRQRRVLVTNLLMKELVDRKGPKHIINIGSGNSQEVVDAFTILGNYGDHATNIDSYPPVLEGGRMIAGDAGLSDQFTFIEGNAFEMQGFLGNGLVPADIVQMIGLTDYFKGKPLTRLLNGFKSAIKEGGTGITANITHHDMQAYMEMFGWRLNPRNEEEFGEILSENGFEVEITREPYDVFMVAKVKRVLH
jgi:hypothetical protein